MTYIILLKLAQTKLVVAGFGRLILLFWSSTLPGCRHLNSDSLKNHRSHCQLLIMLSMDSSLWTLFLPSLQLTSINHHTYLSTMERRQLGSMQLLGWPLMSYPQSLQSLLGRCPLQLSDHMASACFAFGVCEELVPYFQGEEVFHLMKMSFLIQLIILSGNCFAPRENFVSLSLIGACFSIIQIGKRQELQLLLGSMCKTNLCKFIITQGMWQKSTFFLLHYLNLF